MKQERETEKQRCICVCERDRKTETERDKDVYVYVCVRERDRKTETRICVCVEREREKNREIKCVFGCMPMACVEARGRLGHPSSSPPHSCEIGSYHLTLTGSYPAPVIFLTLYSTLLGLQVHSHTWLFNMCVLC